MRSSTHPRALVTGAGGFIFHNIYGPYGTFDGGREKVPAALCRRVAAVEPGGEIQVWGDGEQTRSFCYVDDCVEGSYRGRSSDNRRLREVLAWDPSVTLRPGLEPTYRWIEKQVLSQRPPVAAAGA